MQNNYKQIYTKRSEAINQSACALPPLQLRDVVHLLRTDCSLRVDRVRLDLLEPRHDIRVVVLHPVLLPVAPEREEVRTEGIWVSSLGVVFALVKKILQHLVIPAREVVAVEDICVVGEDVRSPLVVQDPHV